MKTRAKHPRIKAAIISIIIWLAAMLAIGLVGYDWIRHVSGAETLFANVIPSFIITVADSAVWGDFFLPGPGLAIFLYALVMAFAYFVLPSWIYIGLRNYFRSENDTASSAESVAL